MAYLSFTPGFKGTAGTLLYLKSKYAADASCAAFCGKKIPLALFAKGSYFAALFYSFCLPCRLHRAGLKGPIVFNIPQTPFLSS